MFLNIVILILIIAAFVSGYRILAGPSVWERLLGFSLLSSKIIMIMILYSYQNGHSYYLDISLVFALLGFVGTTSIARILRKDK